MTGALTKTLLVVFDASIYTQSEMARLQHGLSERGFYTLMLSSGAPPVDIRIFDLDKLEDGEKADIYAAVVGAKLTAGGGK